MNYIIIISNPKIIRVDFQTSNTATDCVKNTLGQLMLQRLDNQVTEISTLYGDLQNLPSKLLVYPLTYSEIAFVPVNDPTCPLSHQSVTSG